MTEWLNPFGSTPDPNPFSEPKVDPSAVFVKKDDTISKEEKKEVLAAVPPVEKLVELSEEEKAKNAKKQELLDKIVSCLKDHNNLESDIPRNHEYWGWLNQYRGLNARP